MIIADSWVIICFVLIIVLNCLVMVFQLQIFRDYWKARGKDDPSRLPP